MKAMMVSLGCDKNRVDSEMMLGLLADNGYEITDDEAEADVVVINSCSFISDAKEESINTIIELGELKNTAKLKCLVCAGCLAQRYSDEIQSEMPEVDVIIGTRSFHRLIEGINQFLSTNEKTVILEDVNGALPYGHRRVTWGAGHYAYLKIADGCDKKCTYCAIPGFRGGFRSVPMEVLLKEAAHLVENGAKELILVAQETTIYGVDLYGRKMLHELIRELAKLKDLVWIRLLYCYPEEIYDELVELFGTEKKLCHYIDMPVQHGDDYILKRMGRRTDSRLIRNVVKRLRAVAPDIVIRTTLIAGFPGEKEEHFKNLIDFVKEMRFDRLGVFPYSAEEGTVAAGMTDKVKENTKKSRCREIMEVQQAIAFEKADKMIGQTLEVMVEGTINNEALVCRSYMDAPDVDGYIFVPSELDLTGGTMLKVRITGSNEYDLIGEITDEFTE